MIISENQRQEAIAYCDRIAVLNDRMQVSLNNILRILDNCANGRDPNDGVVPLAPMGDA